MSVRTVTLTAEAYKALAAAKEEGESFSSVVRRLTGAQIRLSDFAGAWKDAPKARVAALRRFEEQTDRISAADVASLANRPGRRKRGEPR